MTSRLFTAFTVVASLAMITTLLPGNTLSAAAQDRSLPAPSLVQSDQTLEITSLEQPAHNVELVGQIGGRAAAAAVRGHRAYLGVGPRLLVLDIADRTQPILLGQTAPLRGLVRGLALGMGLVYVASDSAGLYVVNVTDPTHPIPMGLLDTPGQAMGVVLAHRRAYVADGDAGLRVVNIFLPFHPTELGFYDTPGTAYGVAVAGHYAYVADGETGLRVVDVVDPRHPVEVGFYDTPGDAWDVAVVGKYAYVADRDGGLRVVDISDPVSPTEAGYYDTPGWAQDVALDGDYVYLADAGGGLLILRFNP